MSEHIPRPTQFASTQVTRRAAVGAAAAAAGAVLFGTLPEGVEGQQPVLPAPPTPLPDPSKVLGAPTSAMSARSPFVVTGRTPTGAVSGSSLTPLHQFMGNITPTDLQFERHHSGVPTIDPAKYQLVVHGLVDREMIFTLDDLMSLPSVTRVHFLECSGNGRAGYKSPKPELSPQNIDGLLSNAEWTGVPVSTILAEVGANRAAEWALAEGGDSALMSRSVPMSKLRDDAMLVFAQNGEPLRPPAGYPVRLFLPGWEGNTNVKWLRRLEVISEPNMSKDETSKYTDPLPNATARLFSFDLDAKSTITYPTYPSRLMRQGWVQISGLAWSGRGKITAVDVSTDGGKSWVEAQFQGTPSPKAAIRFTHMWKWDGSAATLMSRAVDETGYVQPTFAVFKAGRGPGTDYHYNHVRAWKVGADGVVVYGGEV